ncbi:MAG: Mov34/MPN/PAD-1 family protein [Armatimonadetes bacterium]|nr:Mov34/MPN/PAD-1 family protein [Armatimonadota bacterium]MDE2205789.1 Mov34/MPN/PAD-1 family protein [Armatimonadota bacterium]
MIAHREGDIEWQEADDAYRPRHTETRRVLEGLLGAGALRFRPGRDVVVLQHAAWIDLRRHLAAKLQVEQGGLLIGRAFSDSLHGGWLVVVDEALPAEEAEETLVSVEWTPKSWEKMLPRLKTMTAETTIVGSYHSHPGHGVYLSELDLETQRGLFPEPWQIALVVDPVRDEGGVFLGEQGKRCPDWCVACRPDTKAEKSR